MRAASLARRGALVPVLTVLATGCSVPFVGGGDDKAECDRFAAQAIETGSAREARDLAARATDCYARIAR